MLKPFDWMNVPPLRFRAQNLVPKILCWVTHIEGNGGSHIWAALAILIFFFETCSFFRQRTATNACNFDFKFDVNNFL